MSNYKGKSWEADFKESFKGTKYEKGLMRLYDACNGFSGVTTPCDFVIYSHPNFYCFELKAVQDKRLDFAKIRPNQLEGLSKWSENKGVIAGVLVNFYTYGSIFFIPVEVINLFKSHGKKSINMEMCEKYCYKADGSKKRTRFRINVLKTVEDLREFEHPFIDFGEE